MLLLQRLPKPPPFLQNAHINKDSKMPSLLTKHLPNLITCKRDGCDRKHVSNWLVITLADVFKEPECNPPGKIKVDSQT
jgi:hypothetical protein